MVNEVGKESLQVVARDKKAPGQVVAALVAGHMARNEGIAPKAQALVVLE